MKYGSLLLLASILLLSACTKEIKVIKNPPNGSGSQVSNLFAIISSEEEMVDDELPDDIMPHSLLQRKFHSISTEGLEQDLLLEDGSKLEGRVYLDGVINTKSGVLVSMGIQSDMADTVYNIYQLIDGKTLKLISANNRFRLSYKDLQEGYRQTTENRSYFCSTKGIMMWNDDSKTLETLRELNQEQENCYGKQIKNQFYFTLYSSFEDEISTGTNIKVERVIQNGNVSSFEMLDETQFRNNEYISVSSFSEIGSQVIFLVEYQNYNTNENLIQIVKVNKNNTESEVVYEREKTEEINYLYAEIFKNGQLFDGKIIISLSYGESIDPVDFYVNDSFFTSVSQVNSKEYLTYDGDSVELFKQITGEPLTEFRLVNSEDTFFFFKSQSIFYFDEQYSWITSYQDNSLLDLDLNLVHQFQSGPNHNSQVHNIKGKDSISVSVPQEGGGHKISIFILPTETQPMIEDTRFSDRLIRGIYFINFYDKVLFQADVSNGGDMMETRDSISGFFGDDGLIRIINKIKAMIGLLDT